MCNISLAFYGMNEYYQIRLSSRQVMCKDYGILQLTCPQPPQGLNIVCAAMLHLLCQQVAWHSV